MSVGIVLDYDAMGDLVGIDIDNASRKVQDDPIVTEVRAQRDQLVETADGTVEALVRLLREREAAAGRTSVSLPSREPAAATRAG